MQPYVVPFVRPAHHLFSTQSDDGKDLVRTQSKDYFVPKWEQTFAYDDDGNMTHDSVWDYTYDAENRLIAMQHRAEVIGTGMIPSASARKLVFAYDYQSRRVRKTVYGGWNGSTYTGSALSDTKYLYDGWNLIAEFNVLSSMSVVRSYSWGLDLTGSLTASGGVGALLQVYDAAASKTLLPAYDGNGNIAAMTNADSGALEAIYEYDPFGNLLRKEGSYASTNPFRFSTKYTDKETGLAYYGHRYYSPDLGRFINRDPIEEQGGVNLYSFVRNNAINAWDYLGMVANVNALAILRYSDDPAELAWNQRPHMNSDPGAREGGGGAANLMSFRPDVVGRIYNALAPGVAAAMNQVAVNNAVSMSTGVAQSIGSMNPGMSTGVVVTQNTKTGVVNVSVVVGNAGGGTTSGNVPNGSAASDIGSSAAGTYTWNSVLNRYNAAGDTSGFNMLPALDVRASVIKDGDEVGYGLNGSLAIFGGMSVSIGYYRNTRTGERGLYGSIGGVVGFDAGLSVERIVTDEGYFEGDATNVNVSTPFIVGGSIITNMPHQNAELGAKRRGQAL